MKRVHGKAWHLEMDRMIKIGSTKNNAKKDAKTYATTQVDRWKIAVAFDVNCK
jgi:hypothetical protein